MSSGNKRKRSTASTAKLHAPVAASDVEGASVTEAAVDTAPHKRRREAVHTADDGISNILGPRDFHWKNVIMKTTALFPSGIAIHKLRRQVLSLREAGVAGTKTDDAAAAAAKFKKRLARLVTNNVLEIDGDFVSLRA
jgi:hypothetical protein